jgi:predicted negative regulator of RcsB-dependent stress response
MTNTPLTDIEDEMDLIDWFRANSRWVAIGAVVVLGTGAVWWGYTASKVKKERNAATELFKAKQSMYAGNLVLAQSDLDRVVSRFGGTGAGAEGAMLLAQMHFDQAKYQEGIATLEKAADGAPDAVQVQLRSLIGDGYLSMKNAASAAKEYERAAELSAYGLEKATQRAKAARAYMAVGDTAKARDLWAQLAADTKNPSVAAEAKVRLGELTARIAKTG